MIEKSLRRSEPDSKRISQCQSCFDAGHLASEVLSSHIDQAVAALNAENLTTDEKVKRVMSILGRAQTTAQTHNQAACAQLQPSPPATRLVPVPKVTQALVPMAVFVIGDAGDGMARASRYAADAPAYFKQQGTDANGKPHFKQT